jgi:hypothetical protein
MPIILATREAEIGRIAFEASLSSKFERLTAYPSQLIKSWVW